MRIRAITPPPMYIRPPRSVAALTTKPPLRLRPQSRSTTSFAPGPLTWRSQASDTARDGIRLDREADLAARGVRDELRVGGSTIFRRHDEVRIAVDLELLPTDDAGGERRGGACRLSDLDDARARAAASVAATSGSPQSGSMTTVGPSPPAASLSAPARSGSSSRTTAWAPASRATSSPSGRRPAATIRSAPCRRAACTAARPTVPVPPEDEDSVPGTDLRAPDNGKPAGNAGRPAGGCELVRNAVGKLERLLFRDRRELRQRPVAPAAAEPVVRDVHAGARLERVGLDDRPHAFRAGDVRRLRRAQVVLARGEGGIDRVQRNRVDPNERPSGVALGRIGLGDLGESADLADERRLHRRSLTSPSS